MLQCAPKLDVVNICLCDTIKLIETDAAMWQNYLFQFGKKMTELFKVNVSTKFHRFMRHVQDHIIQLGCLKRCSSEENEMLHKKFKSL